MSANNLVVGNAWNNIAPTIDKSLNYFVDANGKKTENVTRTCTWKNYTLIAYKENNSELFKVFVNKLPANVIKDTIHNLIDEAFLPKYDRSETTHSHARHVFKCAEKYLKK